MTKIAALVVGCVLILGNYASADPLSDALCQTQTDQANQILARAERSGNPSEMEAAQRMFQIVQSNCQTNQEIQQDAQQLMQSILNIFSDGGVNDN